MKNNNRKNRKTARRKDSALISHVANKIRALRNSLCLSQEQLEEKTKISVGKCESGKYDMTLTTIGILSKHLNVKPHELLI